MARILSESGTLTASKTSSGTYPVRIITEGKGSSGTYSRALLEKPETQRAFEGSLSFLNHPLDPEKPHLRPVESIAGRLVGGVQGKVGDDGKYGLYSEFKPNTATPGRAEFIEEYADALGLSIYIAGDGTEQNGEYLVESFDGSDPYKSVDIVVAAGRGGRFERAAEAYKRVSAESGTQPAGTPPQEKKENMDKEIEAAIAKAVAEALKPVTDFIAESKAAAAGKPAVEADASALEDAATKAVEAYDEKVKLINAATELLPSQVESLLASAKAGADVAPLIESAKKTVAELTKHLTESDTSVARGRYVEASQGSGNYGVEGMFGR